MKGRLKSGFIASCILLTMTFFVGCDNKNKTEVLIEKPELSFGAIVTETNGELRNYNLINNKYVLVDKFKGITDYNRNSSNYILNENGKFFATDGVEKIPIAEGNLSNVELSSNGEYVSYFLVDEGYKFQVTNIAKNHVEEIKSDVVISGDLIKWIGEAEIAYYGISEEGVNGIFSYNFKTKEEKTLYKLESGFVEKIIASGDILYFVLNNFGESKNIIALNSEGHEKEIFSTNTGVMSNFIEKDGEVFFILKEGSLKNSLNVITKDGQVKKLAEGILELKDICKLSDKYVVLGTFEGDTSSLYFVEESGVSRVVYGFPAIVMNDRQMVKGEDGKVLFVGKESEVKSEESIYSIDENRSISLIYKGKGQLDFVKMH